jgi:predicted anti-sigma-YlaC factor YlaD
VFVVGAVVVAGAVFVVGALVVAGAVFVVGALVVGAVVVAGAVFVVGALVVAGAVFVGAGSVPPAAQPAPSSAVRASAAAPVGPGKCGTDLSSQARRWLEWRHDLSARATFRLRAMV